MTRAVSLISLLGLATVGVAYLQHGRPASNRVGGGCDGCALMYEGMPEDLDWKTAIALQGEPGEPLEVRGVIYQSDGKTPVTLTAFEKASAPARRPRLMSSSTSITPTVRAITHPLLGRPMPAATGTSAAG